MTFYIFNIKKDSQHLEKKSNQQELFHFDRWHTVLLKRYTAKVGASLNENEGPRWTRTRNSHSNTYTSDI